MCRLQTASFVPPTVRKPQNSSFTVINDKEKEQILIFKKVIHLLNLCLAASLAPKNEFGEAALLLLARLAQACAS